MGTIKSYSEFNESKKYGQKIKPEEFKAIKKGSKLLYMGMNYSVKDNDGYVLTLVPRDGGSEVRVNLSQFNHGGQINEGEVTKKTLLDLWDETYGENFIKEYPAVAKILKNRPNDIDRREIARIWDETYGEDFEKEYSGIWNKLK